MGGWESLRVELRRVIEEAPGAFQFGPNPDSERRSERRVLIGLAAWATDIAAEFHATYGDFVELQVGAMKFPSAELLVNPHILRLRGEPAGDAGFEVEAPEPLVVRTGHHVRRDVLVTNRTARTEVLITNGELSARVVDGSGGVVGLFAGPHPAPRVGFEIGPHASRPVPVLIGTASVVPELGYAVPPGNWGLVVVLGTETGGTLLARLDLTITA